MRYVTLILVVLVYGCSSEKSPLASGNEHLSERVSAHETSDAKPIYEQYDFRWSNWDDSKSMVTAAEPGELDIVVSEGSGLSALESAWTTDVFVFSNGEKDTVDVEYEFAGDELFAGHYWFDETMTPARSQMLIDELNVRYGDPVSVTEGRVTWMKNGDTEVYITLSDTGGGCLHYYSPDAEEKVERAKSYNKLPIRVVVPDRS